MDALTITMLTMMLGGLLIAAIVAGIGIWTGQWRPIYVAARIDQTLFTAFFGFWVALLWHGVYTSLSRRVELLLVAVHGAIGIMYIAMYEWIIIDILADWANDAQESTPAQQGETA